jgi:hypothetical protein
VNHLLAVGQVWRSHHSGRLYRVLEVNDPLGIAVEELACTFPRARVLYLPVALFSPPGMELEDVCVAEEFDRYLARLADLEG